MEFEDLPTIPEKPVVLLCNKCLEKKEYSIPIFELNSNNTIKYKCSKNHSINKKDVCMKILDDDLRQKLTHCKNEEHGILFEEPDHLLCAWCEHCKSNLCELDIACEEGHDYILYEYIKPEDYYKQNLKEKIDKLKTLIDKYYEKSPSSYDEIKYLIKTYNRNFMNYNLYYNEQIINYQTCVNILFNNNDDFKNKDFELYENNLNRNEYISLYKEILNTNKLVNARVLYRKFFGSEIIIPLIKEDNNIKENNETYFGIFCDFLEQKGFFIYDINKNNINKIELKPEVNHGIMKYRNNIIIIYDSSVFNIIYFSQDFTTHQILKLNVNFENKKIFSRNLYKFFMDSTFNFNVKLLKTTSKKLLFLYNGKAYSLDLGKYFDNNLNVISGVESLNLLSKESNYVMNANSIYYKFNNIIVEGIILISFSPEKSKFEILMLDENLEKLFEFDFKYPFNQNTTYTVFDINFNYLNDIISVFINHEIFLLSPASKDIIKVIDISNYVISINAPKFDYQVFSFYYYNKTNKKIEQAILLTNNYTKEIYNLHWEDKLISLNKKYSLINNIRFVPIISSNVLNTLNQEGKSNEISKIENYIEGMIFVDSEKILLIE